jgi:methionyl-tRNA formyltransferase
MNYYNNVIVIGTGRLAKDCLGNLLDKNINLVCIEPVTTNFPLLSNYCFRNFIKYLKITNKKEIDDYFLSITEKTLVVSAYNIHIFSANVVSHPKLLIINFHNSLLPKYRGRNSPSWAIFNMDTITGITWHKISDEIDKGAIIIQESLEIPKEITAIKLSELCLLSGSNMFAKIVDSLLENNFQLQINSNYDFEKIHYSNEIPNNGFYDINWKVEKGFAFLRSLDYSDYRIFPSAKLEIGGIIFDIIEYKKFFLKELYINFNISSNQNLNLILSDQTGEYLILTLKK